MPDGIENQSVERPPTIWRRTHNSILQSARYVRIGRASFHLDASRSTNGGQTALGDSRHEIESSLTFSSSLPGSISQSGSPISTHSTPATSDIMGSPSLLCCGPHASQIEIYQQHMQRHNYGHPLLTPGPSEHLPAAYRESGIMVGDVGVISPDGGFSHLFSVLHKPTHPRNAGMQLPPDFVPFITSPDMCEITQLREYDGVKGAYLADNSVARVGGGNDNSTILRTSAKQAAVLMLPETLHTSTLLGTEPLHGYIRKHLPGWYKWVRDVKGWNVKNGDIRVVESCRKSSGYGIAVVSNGTTDPITELTFSVQESRSISECKYRWSHTGCATVKAGPSGSSGNQPANQCLFIGATVFKFGPKLWSSVAPGGVSTFLSEEGDIMEPRPESYRQAEGQQGTSDRSSSSEHANSNSYGAQQSCNDSEQFEGIEEHSTQTWTRRPDDILADVLLRAVPSASFVSVCTQDWGPYLTDATADDSEFIENVLSANDICEEAGMVYFKQKKPILGTPMPLSETTPEAQHTKEVLETPPTAPELPPMLNDAPDIHVVGGTFTKANFDPGKGMSSAYSYSVSAGVGSSAAAAGTRTQARRMRMRGEPSANENESDSGGGGRGSKGSAGSVGSFSVDEDDPRAPTPDIETILSASTWSRRGTRRDAGVKRVVSDGAAFSSSPTSYSMDSSKPRRQSEGIVRVHGKRPPRRVATQGSYDDDMELYDPRLERALEGVGSEEEDETPVGTSLAHATRTRRAGAAAGDDSGGDSDSSLDLHTPLPNLMVRHGLISPHSKLLPAASRANTPYVGGQDHRPGGMMSLVSSTSLVTKSGILKDERDTPMRRVRHRDGKLLAGGIGLTTGLGWSDSEDEDAPSPLTRRLSTLKLSQRSSASSVMPSSSRHSNEPYHPLSRSYSSGTLLESDREHKYHEFGTLGEEQEEVDSGVVSKSMHGFSEWDQRQRRPSSGTSKNSKLAAQQAAKAVSGAPPTAWQGRKSTTSLAGRTNATSSVRSRASFAMDDAAKTPPSSRMPLPSSGAMPLGQAKPRTGTGTVYRSSSSFGQKMRAGAPLALSPSASTSVAGAAGGSTVAPRAAGGSIGRAGGRAIPL